MGALTDRDALETNDSAVKVLGEPTLKRIAQELVSTVCLILIWSNTHEIRTMPYDPSKHLRRSIRLKGYDYTRAGAYFVTIVTQNRACLFGAVVQGKMRLNPLGQVVRQMNSW